MQRRANPTLIMACALLMSAPSIKAAITGALTIDTLCVHLALAVVFSYVGVRIITRIIAGYAATPPWRPAAERVERGVDADLGS